MAKDANKEETLGASGCEEEAKDSNKAETLGASGCEEGDRGGGASGVEARGACENLHFFPNVQARPNLHRVLLTFRGLRGAGARGAGAGEARARGAREAGARETRARGAREAGARGAVAVAGEDDVLRSSPVGRAAMILVEAAIIFLYKNRYRLYFSIFFYKINILQL